MAVCACLPNEQHQIGLLAVAYRLACLGYRLLYLGACFPLQDLDRACSRLRPPLVCLSVTRRELLQQVRAELARLCQAHAADSLFYLGGQGVPAVLGLIPGRAT